MPTPHIVAADHPALDHDVECFVAELRGEQRYFGPSARSNPKPVPSRIDALRGRGGFRMAAREDGRIVGLVRVDGAGDVAIAVASDRRGDGIGTALGRAAVERAIDLHYTRLTLRSTHRSRAARRIGEALGCVVVDVGRGRTDLIVDLAAARRIA